VDATKGQRCQCKEGYKEDPTLTSRPGHCPLHIDECTELDEHPCEEGPGGICSDRSPIDPVTPFFVCACEDGFEGSEDNGRGPTVCKTNDCTLDSSICATAASCVNGVCQCPTDYDGDGYVGSTGCVLNQAASPCEDLDCDGTTAACEEITTAAAECVCFDSNASLDETGNSCECDSGYTGDGSYCILIPTCENTSCRRNEVCEVDANGDPTCVCDAGFFRIGASGSCNNKNECTNGENECDPVATCSDTYGSYVCWCPRGYYGNGRNCNDSNECQDPDRCSSGETCVNTVGSYTCITNPVAPPTPEPSEASPITEVIDPTEPRWTSSTDCFVEENRRTIYLGTAEDEDGDDLTFSYDVTNAKGGASLSFAWYSFIGVIQDYSTGRQTAKYRILDSRSPPDYENPQSPWNLLGDNTFKIRVKVSDGFSSKTQDVTCHILDAQEGGPGTPVFSGPLSVTMSENTALAYTASATDPDGDQIVYYIDSASSDAIQIDDESGDVFFEEGSYPDFEEGPLSYDVRACATDQVNSACIDVTISIANVNEAPNAAVFDKYNRWWINEGEAPNLYSFDAFTVTDPEGDDMTYALAKDCGSHQGLDNEFFTVESNTGALTNTVMFDYENPLDKNSTTLQGGSNNEYKVTISASDGELSTCFDVTVVVQDVDEPPVITSGASVDIFENITADTLFYNLTGVVENPTNAEADIVVGVEDEGLGLFVITIDGQLSTKGDLTDDDIRFDNSTDADNEYKLSLRLTDTILSLSANITLIINVIEAEE